MKQTMISMSALALALAMASPVGAVPTSIPEILGAAHLSPFAGKGVSGIVGIVASVISRGCGSSFPARRR